jgi:hypothetical protein
MRIAKWLSCLLAMTVFGFTGVVGAQELQYNIPGQTDQGQPVQTGQQPGEISELPPHQLNQPASQQQDRSLLQNNQSTATPNEQTGDKARGELGVWMGAIDGPGLRIRRITSGSAAEQAGLRMGDVLMQINDRWATSPREAAEIIRAIPIGETVKLQIWRDGQVQEMSAKMAAVRQPVVATTTIVPAQQHDVGFRGDSASPTGDLSQRVIQLERQLGMMSQELQQLREQMTQMRASGAPPAGIDANTAPPLQPAPPSEPAATAPPAAPAAPAATELPAAPVEQPKTDAAPATEQPSEDDSLFK